MYEYKAVITNVVDGDTFDMDIDLGFHIHIHERVRLLGVDTPEKFGEEKELGLIMKEFAEINFLGKEVIIRPTKSNADINTDSFGRWLVNVFICNGDDISNIYHSLGVDKRYPNYNKDNVLELKNSKYFLTDNK
jgi:micrococcal nuclease